MGNKIISIVEDEGVYKCVTTNAPLDEIFKVLSLSASIELITDTISSSIEDADGNICNIFVTQQNYSRASIGSPNVLIVNFGKEPKKHGPFINGSMSLGAVATINIDLEEHKSECSLALYGGLDGEIGYKFVTEFWNGYKQLLPRKGKWNIVTGVVALGPVVLRPFIDASLGLQGAGEGELLRARISKQFGVKVGIKDGNSFYENFTNSDTNIVKSIHANVKGNIDFVTKLDFGIGLYTKNIAVDIEPYISVGFNTDFRLNNENLFKDHPNLNFNITADADAFFYAEFFGIRFSHTQESLTSINLFSYSWPLLPSFEKESLEVTRRNDSDSLIYDAEYELTGGLLNIKNIAPKLPIKPSFRVYNGENEVYNGDDTEQEMSGNEKQKFSFELAGLKKDVIYTGKPCLIIADNIYDEEGVTFPSICVDKDHPHAIDMGLPSGILWHCMNLGASSPRDFGEYYPVSHGKDIATEKLGQNYSTPTKKQFEELIAYTKQRHIQLEGVKGMLFEASNGNSLFFPAAAQLWWGEGKWQINNEGSGAYWTLTQSADEDYFYFLEFSQGESFPFFGNRDIDDNRLTIRPIYKETEKNKYVVKKYI